MAYITIKEQVHVDIRIDGATQTHDFTPGDSEVDHHVADLLVSQGIAEYALQPVEPEATATKKKTSKATTVVEEPAPVDEPIVDVAAPVEPTPTETSEA